MDIIFPSESDYDNWSLLKKKLHFSEYYPPKFKHREIWWISQGINIGNEITGKPPKYTRPILVIKKFDRYIFWGALLSTKIKDSKYYIPVTINGTTVSVIISQVRTSSSKRLWNLLGTLDDKDFYTVVSSFKRLCLP